MKRAPKFDDKLAREYATMWDAMEITRDESAMEKTVNRIIAFRAAYEEVERMTNVPWYIVGIMDMREGGGGACKHLHNGDSLKRPTRQVPANRPAGKGPFTFQQSACDALQIKGLDKITEWTVERMALEFERYNGFGYRQYRKIVSPYLWGGTNHQQRGKYVADGVYSTAVMDPQHGCMPLLKLIADKCEITIPSQFGAKPGPETTPASNVPAVEAPVISAPTAVAGGAGVLGGGALLADPVGLSSTLVAVKGNGQQLLAGVDLTSFAVPLAIIIVALAAAWFMGRK